MNHRELARIYYRYWRKWYKKIISRYVSWITNWNFPKNPIPTTDGKVSMMHCYHFLEHLTGEDAILFLKEVQRVLSVWWYISIWCTILQI
jgi:hypothetical protein